MDSQASLVKAFQGAYAVFAVTNYWEKMDMDLEFNRARISPTLHWLVDTPRCITMELILNLWYRNLVFSISSGVPL